MNISGWLLKIMGWTFRVNIPPTPKCVVCVAPHTSNWDFVIGELGIRSVGMRAGFLMKDTWFFFPMGNLMRALGGIPVKQHSHTNVSEHVVNAFNAKDKLWIAVTPEGTRSPNPNWHKGFLHIARQANIPIVLAYFDYDKKEACIDRIFEATGNVDADLVTIKQYYKQFKGKYPNKFAI